MPRPFRSLRAKWTFALLAVGLLPAAVTAAASWRLLVRSLERSERELETAVVDETTRTLDETFERAELVAARVGRALFGPGTLDGEARLALAQEAFAEAAGVDCLGVYDASGAFVDAFARRGASCTGLDEEKPAQGIAPRWTTRADEGGLRATYVDVVGADDLPKGYVAARVDAHALAARVHETTRARFGRDDGVAVLDDAGRVLVGSLGTGGTGAGDPGDGGGITLLAAFGLRPEGLVAPFVATTQFADPATGAAMVGTVRTLPERRWALVARRPEAEAFEVLASARRTFALLASAMVACALLAGTALGARATRPVRALVQQVRAYAARRFAERSTVHTGDELEELGRSLDDMASDLASSEQEIARRARVEADLSRYLPGAVAASVARGERELALGGDRRTVSVLFADVVGFTSFSERAAPDDVARLLNELFGVLSEVVFRHEGIVDKFMGDCIMAVFGATNEPGDGDDHALRAVRAAADMHRFVEAMAFAFAERSRFEVKLAIGVSTGEALAGNLGSTRRMEFTVLGDAVNVAARLEQIARGGQTLVVAATAEAAAGELEFASLGPQPLRGKSEPVEVFELREDAA